MTVHPVVAHQQHRARCSSTLWVALESAMKVTCMAKACEYRPEHGRTGYSAPSLWKTLQVRSGGHFPPLGPAKSHPCRTCRPPPYCPGRNHDDRAETGIGKINMLEPPAAAITKPFGRLAGKSSGPIAASSSGTRCLSRLFFMAGCRTSSSPLCRRKHMTRLVVTAFLFGIVTIPHDTRKNEDSH